MVGLELSKMAQERLLRSVLSLLDLRNWVTYLGIWPWRGSMRPSWWWSSSMKFGWSKLVGLMLEKAFKCDFGIVEVLWSLKGLA